MIKSIVLAEHLLEYLQSRKLEKQFLKTKKYILAGNFRQVNFKLREPKKDQIYYFRINKQFRAWCIIQGVTLKVFHIDNHQ